MSWLFGLILVPMLLCFCLGAALSTAWWLWRRRSIHAEYEKRRLTAEAESDRLRLRVSALQAADARADNLQLELEKARTEAVKIPKVEGELKRLRLQAELVPELENQIANLRARADDADRLEQQLLRLEQAEQRPKRNPTPETPEVIADEPVIDLRADGDGHRDDLQVIKGIGPVTERTLNARGITTWEQLAALTDDDVVKVGKAIGTFAGRIERDRWVWQAAQLIAEFPLTTPYNRPTKDSRPQQK